MIQNALFQVDEKYYGEQLYHSMSERDSETAAKASENWFLWCSLENNITTTTTQRGEGFYA
jgi:hypothetical protein